MVMVTMVKWMMNDNGKVIIIIAKFNDSNVWYPNQCPIVSNVINVIVTQELNINKSNDDISFDDDISFRSVHSINFHNH